MRNASVRHTTTRTCTCKFEQLVKYLQTLVGLSRVLVDGGERLEWLRGRGVLADDLHAHPDGVVALAADETQVRLAHQTLWNEENKMMRGCGFEI